MSSKSRDRRDRNKPSPLPVQGEAVADITATASTGVAADNVVHIAKPTLPSWVKKLFESVPVLAAISAFLYFVGIANEEGYLNVHHIPTDLFLPDIRVLLYRGFRFILERLRFCYGIPALFIFFAAWATLRFRRSREGLEKLWPFAFVVVGVLLITVLLLAQADGIEDAMHREYTWVKIECRSPHKAIVGRLAAFNKDAVAVVDKSGMTTVVFTSEALSIQTQANPFSGENPSPQRQPK